ncbi:MAG: PIN domain-containing protein [Chloroflexi bacterium]|nr:PIN domain-containing protein [Chloroflexota bacterium]PWB47044.1 MAG: VapC toxin family PIN domain ribonuclease [Dehalococcoidia bacterium]
MTLVVDTGPILAQIEPADPPARDAARVLAAERSTPIMPLTVAAELDYMLTARGGPSANRSLLRDLAANRFIVPGLEPEDFATIQALNERYRDLSAGLADLSIVILAARYRTNRILTFDQRHFRLIQPLQGGTFTLLPFDEPAS